MSFHSIKITLKLFLHVIQIGVPRRLFSSLHFNPEKSEVAKRRCIQSLVLTFIFYPSKKERNQKTKEGECPSVFLQWVMTPSVAKNKKAGSFSSFVKVGRLNL